MHRIRSLVPFHILDFCKDVWMNAFEPIATKRLELSRMAANREKRAQVGWVAPSQTPSNVIESASDVMDGIAEQQPLRMLWEGTKELEPGDILTAL
jgi:hypothetical protein